MSTTTATNFPSGLKSWEHSTEATPKSTLSQKTVLRILNNKCFHSLQHLKQAHAIILRTGHFQDHYVSGTLVKCYANPHFNNFTLALRVFDHIPRPNVFVCNILIKVSLEHKEPHKAIACYQEMVLLNSRPNMFTYPPLFKACAMTGCVNEGVQFHAHVVKHGLSVDGHIKSAGIQMYASFGLVGEARKMLHESGESDVVCWNAMIDGYLKCGEVEAATELFESMPVKNVGSRNTMISGLASCGMVEKARSLFNDMGKRDDISWSAIIDGYIKEGCYKEALEVFHEMQREKVKLKKYILPSLLTVCANLGSLYQGRRIHSYVEKNCFKVDAVLGTALVDMYVKCGSLDMAWEVFESMKVKEVSTWNAMIGGHSINGQAEKAIELFTKMQEKLKPNGTTFVGVLNACAHAGMVERGLAILDSMKEVYKIEPEMEHFGCVVDLLGRAGLMEEAEKFIESMPVKPNAAVWGALLNACRIHGNVELGEKVGWILLDMEPQNSGRYALLSNIYAKVGRWEDVTRVRKLMKERGIKTVPGSSMIDMDGTVHEFKIGDGSHPQMKEIYVMLERVMEKLQMEGYSPNTSMVLFDIEEEEKESVLRQHSEKIALAFGLLHTEPGTTLRIVKNLRVCEDCHSAFKLVSQIYGRDIIMRDRVRYHHFRNGMCSCKDFW